MSPLQLSAQHPHPLHETECKIAGLFLLCQYLLPFLRCHLKVFYVAQLLASRRVGPPKLQTPPSPPSVQLSLLYRRPNLQLLLPPQLSSILLKKHLSLYFDRTLLALGSQGPPLTTRTTLSDIAPPRIA